ncbi:MAG: hypothetical protein U0R64_09075 [Candidatus Nanopelagicales bacterium]
MLNDLVASLRDIAEQMSTLQWAIAGVLALILVIAVVQQLAKTALFVVVLFAIGVFLMHGRAENWSF